MDPSVECVHPESIKRLVLQVQPVRSPSVYYLSTSLGVVVSSEFYRNETTECIHIPLYEVHLFWVVRTRRRRRQLATHIQLLKNHIDQQQRTSTKIQQVIRPTEPRPGKALTIKGQCGLDPFQKCAFTAFRPGPKCSRKM